MGNSFAMPLRPILKLASLSALLSVAPYAHGANNCPWLNEATASGLLEARAVGSYQAESTNQPAACTFTGQNGGIARVLQIQVKTVSDAATHLKLLEKTCGTESAPLQAIGNEAIWCLSDDRGGRLDAWAFSRVRDQVFSIRISTSQKNHSVLTRSTLQRLISTAAEQVAGNLF